MDELNTLNSHLAMRVAKVDILFPHHLTASGTRVSLDALSPGRLHYTSA
jgi:hypothetical protein